jgi:hypothetical protein
MATKGRAYHEEAWRNAKKICQLNARQVGMARALGMNPEKLPGLRSGPQQCWKLPVGKFIEACYWKRFGGDPLDHLPHKPEPGSCKILTRKRDANAPKRFRDAVWQVEDLVCYLMNLADDLQVWVAQGVVPPEVLAQVPPGTAGDRGCARDPSAGVADASDSAAAPPAAPRVVAARGPGAQVRRRDPLLSRLVFELSQCIFFARCLAIVPLCARTLRSDPMISLARKSPQSVREVGVTGLAIAIECF